MAHPEVRFATLRSSITVWYSAFHAAAEKPHRNVDFGKMAAFEKTAHVTSGAPGSNGESPGKQPRTDLWSIPPGAVELDDAAFWGNGDILDRLSAVLPEAAEPEPTSPGASHGVRAGTRRARRAAEAAGDPGRRRRRGAELRAVGADGLSKTTIAAVLLLSFFGAVLVGAVFTPSPLGSSQPLPSGSSTPAGSGPDPSPVVDGPNECPMYAAPPEGARVPPSPQSGGCFFAG